MQNAKCKIKVRLLRHTPEPEFTVAQSAKLCYSDNTISDIEKRLTEKSQKEFIKKLISLGHLSPFEHISFTFGIEGISRVCTHQLVRHRIASYSQQSQRYVRFKRPAYILPPTVKNRKKFAEAVEAQFALYKELIREGVPEEDARYILPSAWETKIIVTMNARELLHFFTLRCCNRAQWEIRTMAEAMLRKVKKVAPTVFADAGPACLRGPCPEGTFSCKSTSD
jgi:thymidylate synthase (FAD)